MADNRQVTVTEKIDKDVTGLKGALYVHVQFTGDGDVISVYFSNKQKEDDNTLDKIMTALGRVVTKILHDAKS